MTLIKRLTFSFAVLSAFALCAVAPAQATDADAARDQTLKLFQIFKDRDWKTLFDVIQMSPVVAKTLTNRDEFAASFDKGLKDGDPDNAFSKLVDTMSDVKVGTAVIEGNVAYVATSCKVKIDDSTVQFLGVAKLVKTGDTWKWDLSFTDQPDKATEQRFTELFGVPSIL